jgi:ferredoxin
VRLVVDRDICVTHAQCVLAAPEIFRLDQNGEMVCVREPHETLRYRAEAAVAMCPTQAITIEDSECPN